MPVQHCLNPVILLYHFFRRGAINVPGEKVQRHPVFLQIGQKRLRPFLTGRQSRSSDPELREAGFQMLCGDLVKRKVLLRRSAPRPLVGAVRSGVKIRLVPDLPVTDAVPETVCPALVVMADDMLADLRPLPVILGRVDMVLFDLVLDLLPQPVKGLGPRLQRHRNIFVGAGKIVGRRILHVSVKIRKHGADIHAVLPAVVIAERRIVVAGKRNVCGTVSGKIIPVLVVCVALVNRSVVDRIHRFEGAGRHGGIQS